MIVQRIAFWILAATTLTVYAAMLGWSLPTIAAAAGGLPPFDMRPSGYSFADARQFIAALKPDATTFYLDVQQRLDIAYPALVALTLFFSLAALLPRRLGWVRFALAAPTVLIAAFDYLENHAIAAMLKAGVLELTQVMVAEASRWTMLKSTASAVAMSALLVLLLWRGAMALSARWQRRLSPAV